MLNTGVQPSYRGLHFQESENAGGEHWHWPLTAALKIFAWLFFSVDCFISAFYFQSTISSSLVRENLAWMWQQLQILHLDLGPKTFFRST